jgi:uncharacterized membrane protein
VRLAPRAEQAYLVGIGDLPGGAAESYVTDLSADGAAVVGRAAGAGGVEAMRFSLTRGLEGLRSAPSQAEGVSPNGWLVVGPATTAAGVRDGVLWRGPGMPEFLLGGPATYPGGPPLFSLPEPSVVLDDGRVFGSCIQYRAYGQRIGCRLDAPGQVTLLGNLSVVYEADALGNSAGTRYPARLEPIGSAAVLNGVELGYPPRAFCQLPHDCEAAVRDFSTAAAVAVGTSRVPDRPDVYSPSEPKFDTAFVYTSAQGMLRLPDLAGGEAASGAYAVSADGRVIGGFGSDAEGRHAVVWIDRKARRLDKLAIARGARRARDFALREVRAISEDGRTFAGNGVNPRGEPEGFVLTFPNDP